MRRGEESGSSLRENRKVLCALEKYYAFNAAKEQGRTIGIADFGFWIETHEKPSFILLCYI